MRLFTSIMVNIRQIKIFREKLFSAFSTLKSFRFIQKTFSFPNKSTNLFHTFYQIFFQIIESTKNISHFFFYFTEIKSSFSLLQSFNKLFSFLEKSFRSNIYSTNLLRIYIEFLYSIITPFNHIKILFSIK